MAQFYSAVDSLPVLQAFKDWLDALKPKVLPDSHLGDAVSYTLNQWAYLTRYVEDGGAVLFAAGPDFASADSLYRSPLARIIPLAPSGRIYEQGYQPRPTDMGARHPVTEGLGGLRFATDTPKWGRWFRQIDLDPLHQCPERYQ